MSPKIISGVIGVISLVGLAGGSSAMAHERGWNARPAVRYEQRGRYAYTSPRVAFAPTYGYGYGYAAPRPFVVRPYHRAWRFGRR